MSEAKSLVVWKAWKEMSGSAFKSMLSVCDWPMGRYEYAHDLSGRFLGVFREVRA